MKLYAEEGETTQECSDRVIFQGIEDNGQRKQDFFDLVKQCLPTGSNKKIYIQRSWGKESTSILTRTFNSLWLQYGPKVLPANLQNAQ